VQKEAKDKGFSEVLFLDSRHEKYIEEAGASNFFCVGKDGVIRTPELGAILPGITRATVIQLARDKGYKVIEEKLELSTVLQANEVFCSGTGASITPVGSITTADGNRIVYNNGEVGKLANELYNTILDIQYERNPQSAKYSQWLVDPWSC